jgi:hypothetical protein
MVRFIVFMDHVPDRLKELLLFLNPGELLRDVRRAWVSLGLPSL